VALLHQCERVMADTFDSPAEVRSALAHLAGNTLWYAHLLGPEAALTGALSRGSVELTRGHLAALAAVPEALDLYRHLGTTMLELARSRGSIDEATRRRLRALLASEPVRRASPRRRGRRPGG
jgi:predicted short-subunit dehydrogenase-like oxidoreductase (DUF2520 family)